MSGMLSDGLLGYMMLSGAPAAPFTTMQRGYSSVVQSFTISQRGKRGVSNVTVQGYTLYAGSGVYPDFTSAPAAFSQTLPFNYALTPPGSGTLTYYLVVRQRNSYGVESQNQYPSTITIDSSGNLVLPPITAPTALLAAVPAPATIRVMVTYPAFIIDPSPADTLNVWINTVMPNPDTDMVTAQFNISGVSIQGDNITYAPGTYYVLVELYRGSDGAKSTYLVTTVVVPAAPPSPTPVLSGQENPYENEGA